MREEPVGLAAAVGETGRPLDPAPAAVFAFPTDPRDGWEPGAPSVRALTPSVVGGALVPLAVYFVVRAHVHGDAPALAIAGVPAAAWVAVGFAWRRRIDPIGLVTLVGFGAGLAVSAALGGSAFVLKVRDSAFTCWLGLACLGSVAIGRRPVMFGVGKALSAGNEPVRVELYEALWTLPPARAVFRIITAVWGVGLLAEATTRVVLAETLSTPVFVVASPVVAAAFLGPLVGFTLWFSRWARRRVEGVPILGVPADGGGTWWWLRYYLGPSRAAATAG